jgi:hypothetical protein
MKMVSDKPSAYIPLWIYANKETGSNTGLPFTELGRLFFDDFNEKIKFYCMSAVNAASWKDFLSKDELTNYNVFAFVIKYLWEYESIRVPFMNKCNTDILVCNAQALQHVHQKLAEETTDKKDKWKNTYLAEMYFEYAEYIINKRYQPDTKIAAYVLKS